jgi:biopolymer transport protein ExbB
MNRNIQHHTRYLWLAEGTRPRFIAVVVYLLLLAVGNTCRAEDAAVSNVSQTAPAVNEYIPGPAQQPGLDAKEKIVNIITTFLASYEKTSLVHIIKKGGPIMWPLMLASILALGTVLERLCFLLIEKIRQDKKALNKFFDAIKHGNVSTAIDIAKKTKFYVVRTLGFALMHKEKSIANALLYAQEQEMSRFRRGISMLDTIITLAPLLGLLGTVTGMMGSFSLIGGELSAPGAITGGIAEALIATAFGLGIAITSLIPFNFLNTKMETAQIEIETAANQLELLLKTIPTTIDK